MQWVITIKSGLATDVNGVKKINTPKRKRNTFIQPFNRFDIHRTYQAKWTIRLMLRYAIFDPDAFVCYNNNNNRMIRDKLFDIEYRPLSDAIIICVDSQYTFVHLVQIYSRKTKSRIKKSENAVFPFILKLQLNIFSSDCKNWHFEQWKNVTLTSGKWIQFCCQYSFHNGHKGPLESIYNNVIIMNCYWRSASFDLVCHRRLAVCLNYHRPNFFGAPFAMESLANVYVCLCVQIECATRAEMHNR